LEATPRTTGVRAAVRSGRAVRSWRRRGAGGGEERARQGAADGGRAAVRSGRGEGRRAAGERRVARLGKSDSNRVTAGFRVVLFSSA
jgi:hypothetical protein